MNTARQHSSRLTERGGFTLLETLLAIGLMTMIAAVLIGGSSALLKGASDADPETAVLALFQTVRRNAVLKGTILELTPTVTIDENGPDFTWGEEIASEENPRHEETLPKMEEKVVKILAPVSDGAILLGGVASEKSLIRMRFFPDGTCDRVRLEITNKGERQIRMIDPLTCAPLPVAAPK